MKKINIKYPISYIQYLISALAVIGIFLLSPNLSNAATEFISIIDPDNGAGTSYTSLNDWEQAVQSDLTAATTLVFSFNQNTASGTIPDATAVTGQLSGATATLVHSASSTDAHQVLLSSVSGTFQSGEQVYITSTGASSTFVILTTAGDSAIAVAKCRSTGGTADTVAVTIEGWTTSATNYIKVWTDPADAYGRHSGKWNANKYRLDTTASAILGISGTENYMRFDGLQIEVTGSSGYPRGITFDGITTGSGGEVIISNNIIKGTFSGTARPTGINSYQATAAPTWKLYNNIIYGFQNGSQTNANGIYFDTGSIYAYNNTVSNCYNCYNRDGGTFYAKNNIAQNCTIGFAGAYNGASNYNLSSDGTAPGANSKSSTTVAFLDSVNYDYHLSPNDTAAKNASALSFFWDTILAVQYDIDGTARGGAFDIGADEAGQEFVSTVCETTSAGGDCASRDYGRLFDWEDKVEANLSASTTRVFGGSITGVLNENATVNLCNGSTDTNIDAVVVATTSDQILVDGITGTSSPVIAVSGYRWSDEACASAANYWTIGTTTEISSLDALGASPIAVAKIDGAWSASDTVSVSITGWTTDHDNYIKVYTTSLARHQGVFSASKYRLDALNETFNIAEEYAKVEGLQLVNSDTGTYTAIFNYDPLSDLGEVEISGNLMIGAAVNALGSGGAKFANCKIVKFYNNIIYTTGYWNHPGVIFNCDANSTSYAFNNTIYNFATGIDRDAGPVIAVNNLVASSTDPFQGTFAVGTTHNATDRNDSPSGGLNTRVSQTFSFFSTTTNAENFHLQETDAGAKNVGIDINASTTLNLLPNLTADTDGALRDPDDLGWDIGADETAAKQYRSVGNTSTSLGSTGTVTISSTTRTATFSSGQADNVGVGDVIQFGGTGYYDLAFISGRTSSTTYAVQAWDTKAPTATTSAAFNIYRAHYLLDDWEDQVEGDVNDTISDTVSNRVLVNMDLVASNTVMKVPAYAGTAIDTAAVTIDGWVTGAQNYINIYTPVNSSEVGLTQRHSGKWDNTKFIHDFGTTGTNVIINEEYARLDGLQLKVSGDKGWPVAVSMELNNINSDIRIANNIIWGSYTSSNYGSAVGQSFGNLMEVIVYNNIIYGFNTGQHATINDRGIRCSQGNWYVYNNTVVDVEVGIHNNGGEANLLAVNNIIQNSVNGFESIFAAGSDYNISNIGNDAPGANSFSSTTVNFWDAANHDFHLAPGSPGIDQGTSSISQYPISNIQYDIDGNLRRTWDIGADEASVEFVSTVMQSGGDFSSLSAWEAANQVDLTATTTAVFDCTVASGSIPVGSSVVGYTSGTRASSTVMATSSSQILLYNIGTYSPASTTFITGERIHILGAASTSNYCDLADLGNPPIAAAKIDGAWTAADTGRLVIDGWVTGEYNYIKVYTTESARHLGKWNTNKYRLEYNGDVITNNEAYFHIDGLQIDVSPSSGGTYRDGILSAVGNGTMYANISNNIIKSSNSCTNCSGMTLSSGTEYASFSVLNNIVYDFSGNSSQCFGVGEGNLGNTYIYNNTAYSCYRNFENVNNSPIANNNIAQNCGLYCYESGAWLSSGSNNISSDSSATSPFSLSSTTVAFLDAANYDFHLAPADTGARDAGTTTVSVSLPCEGEGQGGVCFDIDGTARGAAFDIGADEVPVEFVSTICESASAGGDCASINYSRLSDWEDKVEADLTSSTTRIFSGVLTGSLSENNQVTLYSAGASTGVSAFVVATTSDQIMVDGMQGLLMAPWPLKGLVASSGDQWRFDASNYWTISGSGDDLGASPIAVAKIDGAWSASDTGAWIDDWTTDNDNYIKIYTTDLARHQGVWDYSRYKIHNTTESSGEVFRIYEEYVKIDGLQIYHEYTGSSASYPIIIRMMLINDINSRIDISNNIIKGSYGSLTGAGYAVGIAGGGWSQEIVNINIWNNIFYDLTSPGAGTSNGIFAPSGNIRVYNNTFHNLDTGISDGGGWVAEIISINNIISSTTYPFINSCGGSSGYNATDMPEECGTNSYQNQVFGFIDSENDDFRLSSTDSGARDKGLDLSATSTLFFDNDINGSTRPFNDTWDIGADEYAHKVIYRSVGPGSTNALICATSTNALTISGATATFTGGTLDNIGVGDALVYNASGSIAFISGRNNSNTSYTVKNSQGLSATAISNDTGWCIFRAYTSLYAAERGDENNGLPDTLEDFDNWDGTGDYTDTDEVGRDLVTNDEEWHIACYGDAVDTATVIVENWTTEELNFLKIFTPIKSNEVGISQRHNGKWDSSKYSLEVSGGSFNLMPSGYINIEGLQLFRNSATGDSIRLFYQNIDKAFISNNIIKGNNTSSGYGIGSAAGTGGAIYAWNNIVYNHNSGISVYADENHIYNNTIYNAASYGIFVPSVSVNFIYNNILVDTNRPIGSNDPISNAHHNITNSDFMYYYWSNEYGANTNDAINASINFVDFTGLDFHLAPDSPGIDQGTSTVSSIVTEDIDGKPIRTYDIGADDASVEFVSTVMQSGGEFSSLSSWEAANQVDLTATTTLVFDVSAYNDFIQPGSSVYGTSSGAVASTTLFATSSMQILLYNIASSTFVAGEGVCVLGSTVNCVTLSDAGNYPIAVAKIDGVWSSADAGGINITGWTTGEYNHVKIYSSETARHDGKWNDNRYRKTCTGSDNDCINIIEDFVRLDGLQLLHAANNDSNNYTINITPTSLGLNTDIRISNNIIKGQFTGTSANSQGILARYTIVDSEERKLNIWNNIVHGYANNNYSNMVSIYLSHRWNAKVYNNTAYNSYECFVGFNSYSTEIFINNLAQNCTNNFAGGFGSASDYNLSSDSTAPGSNSLKNATVTFVDAENGDFRLMPENSDTDGGGKNPAIDAATSSISQFPNFPISNLQTDAAGNERYDAFYDIGALEGPTILYRSVGAHNYNLNQNSYTVTINDSTATFSGDMPANIGVGDVLQYGSPLQAAFITGRTSSSTYEVRSATGTNPTATTSASVVVYRAFNVLSYFQDTDYLSHINPLIDNSLEVQVGYYSKDLVASNTAIFIPCYASTTADTNSVGLGLGDWTSATNTYIKIYTPVLLSEVGESQRHSGVWDSSKYHLETPASPLTIPGENDFTVIDGLQMLLGSGGVDVYFDTEGVVIKNNIVNGGNTAAYGIHFDGASSSFGYVINNIVYNAGRCIARYYDGEGRIMHVYNNTIYHCSTSGIADREGSMIIAKNNAIFNNTDDFEGTFLTLDHNASDDGDGTNAISLGSSTAIWDAAFVDWQNYDFRIRDTASVLYDAGTTITIVTDDIAGNARPSDDAFDIGAFEFVGGRAKYRLQPGQGGIKMKGYLKFK